MKYFFLWASLLVFTFSFQSDDKYIYWNKSRKLTWNDFKGKPQKRFAAASTVYNLDKNIFEINSKTYEVKIDAIFYCYDSWKKVEWANDEVLAHEQKHFDIVELYARKFRKRIKENSYKNYNELKLKSDSIFKVIEKEMDVYQDLYDEETDGSMNGKKQREWQVKIISEIEALNVYEKNTISVQLKSNK